MEDYEDDFRRVHTSTRRGHLSVEHEYELFRRDIQIAADGSILLDGVKVYVLDAPFHLRVDRIDYFHGMVCNSPMALMLSDDDFLARDMVPRKRHGNTVKRITVLQRIWRNIRWRRHSQPKLVQHAHDVVMRVHS